MPDQPPVAPAPAAPAVPAQVASAPAAPVAPATPEVPAQVAPPAAPVESAPAAPATAPAVTPSLGDRLLALANGKADLLAQNRDLNGRVGTLTSQLAASQAEVATLKQQVEALTADNNSFKAAVAQLEAGKITVEQGVTRELAALKVPRTDLPEPAGQTQPGAEEKKTGEAFKQLTPAQKIEQGLNAAWKRSAVAAN